MIEKNEYFVYEDVVIVGIITQEQPEEKLNEYLNELTFLTETAGGNVVKRFTQKLAAPVSQTFLGKGKLETILHFIKEKKITTVIFDDELSPTQLRNIDKILECKVLDRTQLILDIFAQRAQTSYARTQVELAQYQYLLPRLTRLWTHLDKQKGGIGLRGPGETEIETDRRIIHDKITLLKKKLLKIDKQMTTQRSNRGKLVRVAIVGYTNVGKSTLMNLISKSKVFAENKLFATLDTTVRKVVIRNIPFLLSDTVGFIRKLPTQLIESFKSTLDEVTEADILLHIVDISHHAFKNQMNSVDKILLEIKSTDRPKIVIFNKIDLYQSKPFDKTDLLDTYSEKNYSITDWKKSWMSKVNNEVLFISAKKNEGIQELKKSLYKLVYDIHAKRFPYNTFLYEEGEN